MISRRRFVQGLVSSPLLFNGLSVEATTHLPKGHFVNANSPLSLSQWSFHRSILGNSRDDYSWFLQQLHSQPDNVLQGTMDGRDITVMARKLGIDHVDLVNILFFGHAKDTKYLQEFLARARDNGVSFQVLMCDQTGALGASDPSVRKQSIEQHRVWLDAAAQLQCKQLRVNAYGDGSYLQQLQQCSESLQLLSIEAASMNIELLVENHGDASNNGAWLAMLIEMADHPNLGTFTDLDNFFMGGWNHQPERRYDRLQGLIDLAPFTRGVSVKAHDFNSSGEETTLDYSTLFTVFHQQGYSGLYSIEYEGSRLSELEGTQATIALTKKTLAQFR